VLYAATTGTSLLLGLVILLFVYCACRKTARVRQTYVEPAATDYVSETKLKETEADLLTKIEELRMELRDATRLLASTKPETPSPLPPARRVPPGIRAACATSVAEYTCCFGFSSDAAAANNTTAPAGTCGSCPARAAARVAARAA
jgi:hypothetical protein